MKVHLIDGTYELFRAYYSKAPPATADDGREVGAIRTFLGSMAMLLRSDDVTHVGIAFDTVIESFRNEMFDGYKTGDGIEEDLLGQFPLVEEAAEALGMVVWRMIEFETDDALATAAARFADHPEVEQVVICSPDKDFCQCVNGQQVILWDRQRDKFIDEDAALAKMGVAPASVPDYLGLVGDSADGIPGLPGWGAKSTSTVLGRYGHIDAIPDDHEDWAVKVRGAARLAQTLASHRDEARLYRDLATLRRDVPLTETLADLEWRGARKDALGKLCQRIGSQRSLDTINRWYES